MKKLKTLLKTLDDNLLIIALSFFAFLTPLYPKLPIIHVEYTYIYIRADDFFIAVVAVVFFLQWIRRKVRLNTLFLLPTLLFWAAVFASFLWSNYLVKTMPYHQVSFLHAVRRVEYMLIFFIAASAIKTKKDFMTLLYALCASVALSFTYAFGQKFIGFPAVQTMNPAFARGMILLLTPEARISGSFGGHYDLATYVVLLSPVMWGIYFSNKLFSLERFERLLVVSIGFISLAYVAFNLHITNTWIIISLMSLPLILFYLAKNDKQSRWLGLLIALAAIFVLVFTASRISFGAFLLSTPFLALFLKKYRYFIFIIIFTLAISSTSKSLTNRFSKTFQVKQILVNQETGTVYVPQKISAKELPAGSTFINLNKDRPITKETIEYREKIIREATASGHVLSDEEREDLFASLSANLKTVTGFVPDISFATRLQIEWPRALRAFVKNPLLGTGPFSITEATDNDYLRWLGEFGLFGFMTFMGLLFLLAKYVFQQTKKLPKYMRPVFYGLLVGLFGLMGNATYIDVFEASKVAYTFWYLFGIVIGVLSLQSFYEKGVQKK